MNSICKDIFTAIHKGLWLSIEYKNKDENITKYWIRIIDINIEYKSLSVEGLHLADLTLKRLYVYVDSILSTSLVEGTYAPVNERLVKDINDNPGKYAILFDSIPNLKILNYLSECNRLDTTPYRADYSLVEKIDIDSFIDDICPLSEDQFAYIVGTFQNRRPLKTEKLHLKQLAINVVSIPTKQGLYVLAYRKLFLDASNRCLRAEKSISLCKEFAIDGEVVSIHQFLDADDLFLLDDLDANLEVIKDRVRIQNYYLLGVDDRPYIIAIGRDVVLDLQHEYSSIVDMYSNDTASIPIQAFFGDYVQRAKRRKAATIALLDQRINMDQLLAINNAVKYPLTYVQGPPGTGKTSTIINTIITAFFNEKTVLFASYNNHPIDGVFETLKSLKYYDRTIPFPILRLGNLEKTAEALKYMKSLYERVRDITVFEATLDKNHEDKVQRTERLTKLLATYEELLDLRERKEVIERLIEENPITSFQKELKENQLSQVLARLQEIGTVSIDSALQLISNDKESFRKYLFYTSAKHIQRLDEPKNKDLLNILSLEEIDEQVTAFNHYLQSEENVKKTVTDIPDRSHNMYIST